MKIKRILNKKIEPVYDLEMPSFHNFILENGTIAHNCSHSTGYALTTYAGIFLRHNYPLEWWSAILTNAKEREITGKLWPHVKHLLAPPDINLSSDQMEIDYANKKIRAKLGVIRGMGEKSIDPLVQGRPYKDIQDFVNRDVAGPSLSRKLIHVGVLDSLFPPMSTLLEKLQFFEDAIEVRKYNQKKDKAEKEGKVVRQLEPSKGKIPEEYLRIEEDPMRNAAIKKSILPSLLVGLYDLGRNHSKCVIGRSKPSKIMNSPNGSEALLVTGEMLERLNSMGAESVAEDKTVAAIGYVVETKVFDYKKNTRQALKVVADFDGLVKELVLWPDYYSGILEYPKEIKKGNIATFFLKKRANKDGDCSITEIVIEA